MLPYPKSSSSGSVLVFYWKSSTIEKSHQVKRDVEMSSNGKNCLCCGDLADSTHWYSNGGKSKYNLALLAFFQSKQMASTQIWLLYPQMSYVMTCPLIVWPAWPFRCDKCVLQIQQIAIHCLEICSQYIVIHCWPSQPAHCAPGQPVKAALI